MDQWYQEAIEIVTGDHDFRAICIAVAKAHPKVLCEAIGVQTWQLRAQRVFVAEGKVAAIKSVRAATGMDLKDAKHAVDGIEASLNG